jgi:hypothetical protein
VFKELPNSNVAFDDFVAEQEGELEEEASEYFNADDDGE